jgi:aryl-alcohol dehydrogenase-like predicted oxidoreductase
VKLALGTVQFGLAYGAFNVEGRPSLDSVSAILESAAILGIDMLDTAQAYGESEAVLGSLCASDRFKLVTKVQKPEALGDLSRMVDDSLARLGTGHLYGLMAHNADDLLGTDGDALWSEMEGLRGQGLIAKIGLSVYSPEQADLALRRFGLSIVQLPLNVFDQRAIHSGTLERLKARGVEVHARSMLLQGFALADPKALPPHLRRFRPEVEAFARHCEAEGQTRLEAAYGFVASQAVDKIIVGIDSSEQLAEIGLAASANHDAALDYTKLASHNLDLIDPSRWAR